MPVIAPLEFRDLYGGAIKCAVPVDFFDVSDLREIPNTQEVFAHPTTDQSLIFDLLEYQNVPDNEAAQFHFQQIAECNDALPYSRVVETIALSDVDMPGVYGFGFKLLASPTVLLLGAHNHCTLTANRPNCPRMFLLGDQSVSKFNESDAARNAVSIYLALVRLPTHGTDAVITFNCPTAISHASSSAGSETAGATAPLNLELFKQILHTFTIVDYTLFDA